MSLFEQLLSQDTQSNTTNSAINPMQIDLNLYKRKDPNQNYGGFGYALNNLLRNPYAQNMLSMPAGGGYGERESFIPSGNEPRYGLLGNVGRLGMPFMADVIYGNKYRTIE